MKNISIIFTLAFIFLANASFAQIKLGTYYAFDTRFLGGINGLLNLDVKAVTDKGIVYLALNGTPEGEKEQSLLKVGEKQYANTENTRQLVVRADGDLEHYVIENDVIKEVYLFTQDKSTAKTKWKVVKKELGDKVNKQSENLAGNLLSYFYAKDKTIKLNELYTGQDEIKIIINFDGKRYNDYELKKVEENVYLYSDDRRGGVSIVFARFFPTENKMVVIRQPFGNNPDTYIAQKGAFNLSEADNQKLKDFQAYTLNYLAKHRAIYFANFKSNTSADLPQAKITEATKAYFEEEYTLLKVKLITSAWSLERNEFGRTLRRLHTVLAYLKEKKTGKCAIAFRHIGQEFDGSSYGDVVFYKRDGTYYDLVDDKKNTLRVFLLSAEYEIPCNEVPK